MPSLVEVLIRFRRWKVAVTADVSKAFLQIALRKEDQDCHRFLWQCGDQLRVMRFKRVTFGVCCSPFLLGATIQHHLALYPPSRAVREMTANFYVDDLVSGADSEEEASSLLHEAQTVMSEAGMCLTKCVSNSPMVFDKAHALAGSDAPESVKVLGVKCPDEDAFSFEGVELHDVVPTKRVLLSLIARFFDPLGFAIPYIMVAKCLFQEVWSLGLEWDEPLPVPCRDIFSAWCAGLEVLKQLKVPRVYFKPGWSELARVELHAFSDASPKAYGTTVYLRAPLSDGAHAVVLVMSKGRVAPLKAVSLPRLELLGCLMGARLVTFVRRALCLPECTPVYCWTDSTVALGWIRASPLKWKQFVANRVSEIQSLTSPAVWMHCPGECNPADLTTRGVSAVELVQSEKWLSGPSWLSRWCVPDAAAPVLMQHDAPSGALSAPCGAVSAPGGAVSAPGGALSAPSGGAVSAPCGAVSAPGGAVSAPCGAVSAPGGALSAPSGGAVSAPGGAVSAPGGALSAPSGGAVSAPCGAVSAPCGAVSAPGGALSAPSGGAVSAPCGAVSAPGGALSAPSGGAVSARCGAVSASGGALSAPSGGTVSAPCGALSAPCGAVSAPGGALSAPSGGAVSAPCGAVSAPCGAVSAPCGALSAPSGGAVSTPCGAVSSPCGAVL